MACPIQSIFTTALPFKIFPLWLLTFITKDMHAYLSSKSFPPAKKTYHFQDDKGERRRGGGGWWGAKSELHSYRVCVGELSSLLSSPRGRPPSWTSKIPRTAPWETAWPQGLNFYNNFVCRVKLLQLIFSSWGVGRREGGREDSQT